METSTEMYCAIGAIIESFFSEDKLHSLTLARKWGRSGKLPEDLPKENEVKADGTQAKCALCVSFLTTAKGLTFRS